MKKLKIPLIAAGALSIFAAGLVYGIKKKVNPLCYSNIEKLPQTYTAIIFGAGIRNNKPSAYLQDRLDAGIELYKSGKVKRLLLSGDNGQDEYDELTVMKEYCTAHGIPAEDIFVDYAGFDTYSTVYRAKDLFKVDEAIMISQNYHLDRAVYLGEAMGIKSYGYAADREGGYALMQKNKMREYLALLKSFADVHIGRKPRFHGGDINIHGPSNYYKK
ncbi:SanA/YdcF family protein [Edaphocola aurantiacus]|uniref:SanA/YdcF family protein n=1 Tax=Edaphocola aurantiacus TaxID=2601682 RepID=UPI001C951F08|nr:ElyC/SanA/YdcF family protein [Edaphocola aurantiacus]